MANSTAGVLFGPLGKWLADSMGKGPAQVQYNAPSYYTDPNYTASQNTLTNDAASLMPFATSLMTGQGLPPAYAALGQSNSPAFQKMLAQVTGETLGASQEAMGSQGLGGSGVAASAAAGAVGSETANLSYQDFMNSQAQQLQMMGLGQQAFGMSAGITGNQGSMALTNMGNQNQFNLTNAAEASGTQLTNIQLQNQNQANWGSMMGSGASTLANLYGSSQLVPAAMAAA